MARLIAIDQACSQVSARRDESGKTFLTLRGRSGVITREPAVRAPLQGDSGI
jgi:hypothetical protein